MSEDIRKTDEARNAEGAETDAAKTAGGHPDAGRIAEFFEDSESYRHHDELTPFEHRCLFIRNSLAALAAALFILSILPLPLGHIHHTLQGVAYLIGAGAYIAELVEMSDEEKRASKHHRRRVFMPNLFGLLYIILGISHLFD